MPPAKVTKRNKSVGADLAFASQRQIWEEPNVGHRSKFKGRPGRFAGWRFPTTGGHSLFQATSFDPLHQHLAQEENNHPSRKPGFRAAEAASDSPNEEG
jgi:hypothetical protein